MEFSNKSLKSLLAILTPVVSIWCLFSINIMLKQTAHNNRIPAEAKLMAESSLKPNIQQYLDKQ